MTTGRGLIAEAPAPSRPGYDLVEISHFDYS